MWPCVEQFLYTLHLLICNVSIKWHVTCVEVDVSLPTHQHARLVGASSAVLFEVKRPSRGSPEQGLFKGAGKERWRSRVVGASSLCPNPCRNDAKTHSQCAMNITRRSEQVLCGALIIITAARKSLSLPTAAKAQPYKLYIICRYYVPIKWLYCARFLAHGAEWAAYLCSTYIFGIQYIPKESKRSLDI